MSKKKKKNKDDSMFLNEVDQNLDQTYQELIEEIKQMQLRIEIADKKAKKKSKRRGKKKHGIDVGLYNNDDYRRQVRNDMIKELQGNTFLDRVMSTLNDLAPIVVIIARLVASLILAILSMDIVKVNVKPEVLAKMTNVYNAAMAVA